MPWPHRLVAHRETHRHAGASVHSALQVIGTVFHIADERHGLLALQLAQLGGRDDTSARRKF
jgi:hypothetical protein